MDPILSVDAGRNAPQASSAQAASDADRLRKTSQELEGVFLGMLMKSMRATVGTGGLFKEGMDTQTYRDMFDQEIGRTLARAGGIGLAQMVLRDQLLRQSGKAGEDGAKAISGQRTEDIGSGATTAARERSGAPGENTAQVHSPDDR